jgi:hypothetical protein
VNRNTHTALSTAGALILYLTATLALYWPVLLKHYVGDDWLFLHDLWSQGWQGFLARSWNPSGGMLYRPLVKTILVLCYQMFGLGTLPVNIAALACHVLNGHLLSSVCRKLGASHEGGVLAGFLFISLSTLHVDPLLWFVGFFDIGLIAFSLMAVASFIDDRPAAVVLFTVLALLTKEAGVFLLPLFVVWGFLLRRPWKLSIALAVLFALYVGLKLQGTSPFSLEPSHAHAMSLSLPRALVLVKSYSVWILAAFAPLLRPATSAIIALGASLAVGLFWIPNRRHLTQAVPATRLAILAAWGLLALFPVLFLRNQSARYYGLHAAIPLCILIGIALTEALAGLTFRRRVWVLVLAGLPVFAGNVVFTRQIFSEGIRQQIMDDGWFHLVKRSAAVDSVYVHLFDVSPAIPPGSVIHISNVPLDAIGKDAAVQLWYRDSSLTVDVGYDTSTVPTSDPGSAVHVTINPPAPGLAP